MKISQLSTGFRMRCTNKRDGEQSGEMGLVSGIKKALLGGDAKCASPTMLGKLG